jgi:hypothetical protein
MTVATLVALYRTNELPFHLTGEVDISGSTWLFDTFGQSRVGRKASRERAHKRVGGHASLARIENTLSPRKTTSQSSLIVV